MYALKIIGTALAGLAAAVAIVTGGAKLYSHLNEIHDSQSASKSRDMDIVFRQESQNRAATNYYTGIANDPNVPEYEREKAREWLKDLEYDREQIQRMKRDYVEE